MEKGQLRELEKLKEHVEKWAEMKEQERDELQRIKESLDKDQDSVASSGATSDSDDANDDAEITVMRPVVEMESISSVAQKRSKRGIFKEMPVYVHWLALSLYELLHQVDSQLSGHAQELTLNINEIELTLKRDTLQNCSRLIGKAMNLFKIESPRDDYGITSSVDMCHSELTYSALYSVALDRLCFSGSSELDGIILHQGPVRKKQKTQGNPEAADVLGLSYSGGNIGRSYFVSDIKSVNLDASQKETALYAKVCSLHRSKKSIMAVPVLGLAADRRRASLYLFLMAHKRVWGIPIISDVFPNDERLLCIIYGGLNYLVKKPTEYRLLRNPMPFKDCVALKNGPWCRSFLKHREKEVVKIFDCKSETFKMNIEIVKEAGIPAKRSALTKDKRFEMLTYPYYEGSRTPKNIKQFKGVFKMLEVVHNKGCVHGDVRASNLLFDENGQDSYLLDYDLCREAGERYPIGYYFNEEERHPEALALWEMYPIHDRHSLGLILHQNFGTSKTEQIVQLLKSEKSLSFIVSTCLT